MQRHVYVIFFDSFYRTFKARYCQKKRKVCLNTNKSLLNFGFSRFILLHVVIISRNVELHYKK